MILLYGSCHPTGSPGWPLNTIASGHAFPYHLPDMLVTECLLGSEGVGRVATVDVVVLKVLLNELPTAIS